MSTAFLVPKNNANSKLATAITAAATSLTVLSGEGVRFPSTYPFNITIDSEIIQVTNRSNDTMTITRAQEGTAAAAHVQNATVQLNITAKAISDLNAAVNALEAADKSCLCGKNADQSIPNTTWTSITYQTEIWDTDTIHDNVTNNSRLICKTAGKYLVLANVNFDDNSNGIRFSRILLTIPSVGSYVQSVMAQQNWGGYWVEYQIMALLPMNVNDYVEVQVWQDSGGSLNILANGNSPARFGMVKLPG